MIMKALLKFFLSMKTAYGFFFFFVVVMLIGSLSLPNNLAFFSGIDDAPLFAWLKEAGSFGTSWWIYLMVAGFALFAVNTLFCTGEVVLFGLGRRNLLLKLSPQIMHIGVLFIMLGHLLTATLGEKMDIDVRKGETAPVGNAAAITLVDVRETTDENGYAVDWEATLQWVENGAASAPHRLRPARPLYFGAYGLYTKAVDAGPQASAWIRVSRDPGAPWALVGGLLLSLGAAAFLYARVRPGGFSPRS